MNMNGIDVYFGTEFWNILQILSLLMACDVPDAWVLRQEM
jgi:hypothetical protein